MSKNIEQIFVANPITSNTSTDLMYFGQSPYGAGNDAAMTYANFSAQFGAPYTAAALTSSNDTNVTITLGGSPTNALLHAASLTMGWTGQLSLSRGGSNASLTASNGGIIYSTASAMAILAGTATANLPLLSGSSAAPTWGAFALSLGGALTTAGAITTVGAFGVTFTFTNTTAVTFPTSGTLATTSQIPTGAALTETNDTNVTLTLGGSPSTALVNAASITVGWTGTLAGSRGGLGAAITANNGGIYYSTASNGALLAGTATANQVLLSGSSAAPAWSTATYPATTTINQILYSSSANTISGITTANDGVLITSNTGIPSFLANSGTPGYVLTANSGAPPSWQATAAPSGAALTEVNDTNVTLTLGGTPSTALLQATSITAGWSGQLAVGRGGTGASSFNTNGVVISNTSGTGALAALSLTDGQVVIGSSAGVPLAATLTAGTGTTITNGHNTITISSNGANPWVDETGSSVTMSVNTGYTSDDGASLVTFTLPTSSAIGDWIEINGKGSGGWTIAQATGQQIHLGNQTTTSGASGSLSSTNQYDAIRLRCLTANTIWTTISVVGNITVV